MELSNITFCLFITVNLDSHSYEKVDSIKSKLQNNLELFLDCQDRILPESVSAVFSVMSALTEIAQRNPTKCKEVLHVLNNEGVSSNHISITNWAREQA